MHFIHLIQNRKRPAWAVLVALVIVGFLIAAAMPIAMHAQVTFAVLANFDGNDGANPWAGLIQAADGDFYGTTGYGGTNNDGTVFKNAPHPAAKSRESIHPRPLRGLRDQEKRTTQTWQSTPKASRAPSCTSQLSSPQPFDSIRLLRGTVAPLDRFSESQRYWPLAR